MKINSVLNAKLTMPICSILIKIAIILWVRELSKILILKNDRMRPRNHKRSMAPIENTEAIPVINKMVPIV